MLTHPNRSGEIASLALHGPLESVLVDHTENADRFTVFPTGASTKAEVRQILAEDLETEMDEALAAQRANGRPTGLLPP